MTDSVIIDIADVLSAEYSDNSLVRACEDFDFNVEKKEMVFALEGSNGLLFTENVDESCGALLDVYSVSAVDAGGNVVIVGAHQDLKVATKMAAISMLVNRLMMCIELDQCGKLRGVEVHVDTELSVSIAVLMSETSSDTKEKYGYTRYTTINTYTVFSDMMTMLEYLEAQCSLHC